MKLSLVCLLALATVSAAEDLSKPLEALRAVGKEGQGNEAAGKAWQEIVKADAATLPEVLKGMNGANPLAENWLRAAVGVIAAPLIGPYVGWDADVVTYAQIFSLQILVAVLATPIGILRLFDRFDLLAGQAVITPLLRLVGVGVATGDGRGVR